MKKMLKPYEFNRIKYLTFDLVNVYHSVNDRSAQETFCGLVSSQMQELLDDEHMAAFLEKIKDPSLTREDAEAALAELKAVVEPFPLQSEAAIRKLFKKVKKLKIPASSLWDLREVSYFAWNEVASGRKYILTADGRGFYGNIYGQTKNICAICQKTSTVTQFMAVTKTGPDGTYTKNGTYICLDSDRCNQQIQSAQGLDRFLDIIKPK